MGIVHTENRRGFYEINLETFGRYFNQKDVVCEDGTVWQKHDINVLYEYFARYAAKKKLTSITLEYRGESLVTIFNEESSPKTEQQDLLDIFNGVVTACEPGLFKRRGRRLE